MSINTDTACLCLDTAGIMDDNMESLNVSDTRTRITAAIEVFQIYFSYKFEESQLIEKYRGCFQIVS